MHASLVRKPVTALAALAAAAALLFAAPPAARADDAVASSAGVGVARIALIRGQVAVQRGDSGTATAAAINAPVLGADYVTTGDDSRAEVQFDAASAVRLASNVQMRFTRIDAGERDIQLAEGTIELRLLRGDDGRSQIDTPSVSVRPRTAGSYRVTVDTAGATHVTVRTGSADVVTPQGADVLVPGTTLIARGAAANPSLQRVTALALDDFDRFNTDRDVPEMRALADANAPPGVAGIDDLNAYGRWVTDTGYGSVWTPTYVAPGWAPYRDGRWAWEDTYGWTWIGYEPWGWAPYHYGRWYHSPRYGWCWYPARAVVPWSPALVTFMTFGGIGFGFNTIGWVPLAPFEPFTPWWGYGNTVIVNNTYIVNGGHHHHRRDDDRVLARTFRNARYGGATEIAKQRFLEGRFDHPRAVAPEHLRSVEVVRGVVPVVPSDANLRYSDRLVPHPLALRATALQGTFAGEAVAAHRTPIQQQRAALTSVPRAEHPAVVRDVRPEAQLPAAQRNAVTVHDGDAAPKRAITDPWARFGANRAGAPGHPVTIIDGGAATSASTGATTATPSGTATSATPPGTATSATTGAGAHPQATRGNPATSMPRTTQDGGAWKRFDDSAGTRPPAHAPVTVHDGSAAREPVRAPGYAPANTAPASSVPHREYAPAQQQPHYSAPAAPPPHYEPVRSAPAPAHANPPPQAQHAERSTSTQHH
jgi:FecR protein